MVPNVTNRHFTGISVILLGILLVVLVLNVLVQANPGTHVPGRDYGFYVYIGDQILNGGLPYRDGWESKPPAIFYLNTVGLWIGRGSRWGVWMLEFIALFAASAISLHTLNKLWGIWPALGGLLLWLWGLHLTLEGGNLTEEYPLTLHFLSIFLFLKLVEVPKHRLYNLLLGLAFGISFLFRPNNAAVEMAVIVTLLLVPVLKRNLTSVFVQVLWLAIGALAPILLTGLYFWSQGLLRDLLEASLLYNLTYSTTEITAGSPLIKGFITLGWAAWIAVAGYLVGIYRFLKTRDPFYLLLLLGWPLVIYLSDPSKRSYAHYFINWLPFLGMLGGLLVHLVITRVRTAKIHSPASTLMGLTSTLALSLMVFFASGPAAQYQKAVERISERDSIGIELRTRTAVYVQNHTQPGDLVLFWAAAPGENFMSNRESPSAYLFYPLFVHSEISQRISDQFLQDIIDKRPILIVDINDHEALSINPQERAEQIAAGFAWEYPPDNLNEFFKFVEENYYLEAKLGDKTVYRLYGQ
ncbi:MAG TPA: glycosyltransferase family 39 protein [Anaerolineales bacterium]|nr:glycosyltransferase family 39 protein [Anaerolineales bacterium]